METFWVGPGPTGCRIERTYRPALSMYCRGVECKGDYAFPFDQIEHVTRSIIKPPVSRDVAEGKP